ncbi:MAG TPA: hypothetical protein VGN16_04640 [Acidobacteriaceae bacterium]|jgi:hypothetical protein
MSSNCTQSVRIACRAKPGAAGIVSYRVYVSGHPEPWQITPGWYGSADEILAAFSRPLRRDLQDLIVDSLSHKRDVEFSLAGAFIASGVA